MTAGMLKGLGNLLLVARLPISQKASFVSPTLVLRFWLALLLGTWVARVPAAERPVTISAARVGFDGNYKAGRWTTAFLELKASATEPVQGEVHCRSVDGDSVPVTYRDPQGKFSLQPGQTRLLPILFQAGGITAAVQARFTLADGTTWDETLAVPRPGFATGEYIVQLGPSLGAEELPKYFRRREDQAFAVATVTDATFLPTNSLGYEGVDWLLLPLSKASLAEAMSPEQTAALKEWVRGGGRLVLTCASRAAVQFGPEGLWKELAAGEVKGASRLTRTVGLETIGGTTLNIDTLATGQAPFVLDYSQIAGRVDLWEIGGGAKDRPLAIRRAYGLGEVLVLGIDLDQQPWQAWPGRPRLIGNLLQLGRRKLPEQEAGGIRGQATHLGYDDLTGQLRTSLEQYRQIVFLTFTVVAVLAGVYLVLIGPGDYFLLTWLRWPKHWTWGTFAAIVLGLCAAGWWLADRCHGRRVWVNQLEIVDVDLATGTVRGTAWAHVYSPSSARFQLQWQPRPSAITEFNTAVLSWQGLAGRGWGGLNRPAQPSSAHATDQDRGYTVELAETPAALRDLPITVASSKPLNASWQGKVNYPPQAIRANAFGQITGDVVNPFPFELTDCRLLYDEFLYRIPKPLGPGQAYSLGSLTPLNLESRLTERMVVEQKDMATPWNPARTDLPRIVDMLMFHEAANGAGYTGLLHRFQPWLDLSDHLQLNRAILVGSSTVLQGELARDGESLAENYDHPAAEVRAWYRLVIPVAAPERKKEVEQP